MNGWYFKSRTDFLKEVEHYENTCGGYRRYFNKGWAVQ